jgi:GntR family transcriptional repressor for pyruvate dehydrogenase complex
MNGLFHQTINRGSRSDGVVEQLTRLITSGELLPGSFLPSEAELCRQLGVSRPTTREALRTLEARGLVVTKHGIGVQVTNRTREVAANSISLMLQQSGSGFRNLLEVRLMLECQGCSLAARRATDDSLRAISDSIEAMRHRSSTVDEYVEADLRFHLCLAEASKNDVLVSLIHAIRGLLLDGIRATYAFDLRIEERLRDHGQIFEAVAAGDAGAAEAAMRKHLRSSEAVLCQLGLLAPKDGRGQ